MSRYIILSFDDGRKDTYTNAVPIMLENDITATINITTSFLEYPYTCGLFPDVVERAMSIENLVEIQNKGFEIGNHGAYHKNTVEDIEIANKKLEEWGIKTENIGFASPYSYITDENKSELFELIKKKKISYIRSGIQIRREKIFSKILYILERITRSSFLFYQINKKNIFNILKKEDVLKGITINNTTTFKQIQNLIEKMPNNTYIILNFHSILSKEEKGYDDKWSWDKKKFKKLCKYLKNTEDIKLIKTIDLVKEGNK